MSKLRIGWIGCGTHANEMLLPQLIRFDTRIAALCDVDPGRLNATGDRFGISPENRLSDWHELLARPDVPLGSAISEYVDVAHAFFDRPEPNFVNGVLDAVAKVVRS